MRSFGKQFRTMASESWPQTLDLIPVKPPSRRRPCRREGYTVGYGPLSFTEQLRLLAGQSARAEAALVAAAVGRSGRAVGGTARV